MTSATDAVRSVLSLHPDEADPERITQLVLAAVKGHEAEILPQVMGGYVRNVLRRRGKGGWDDFLAERMVDAAGEYVFVRDAEAVDLDAAADRRDVFAGRLDARAEELRSVAGAMRSNGARVVGELPVGVGVEALTLEHVTAAEAEAARLVRVRQNLAGHDRLVASLEARRDDLLRQIDARESHHLVALREARDRLEYELEFYDTRTRQMTDFVDRVWVQPDER
jgi:hypothetical protein